MKNKKEIVDNWLPRYTGIDLSEMSDFVLLTNFQYYLNEFAHIHKTTVNGLDKAMPNATAKGVTMINFGMGSANAATVMDLLSASNHSVFFSCLLCDWLFWLLIIKFHLNFAYLMQSFYVYQ